MHLYINIHSDNSESVAALNYRRLIWNSNHLHLPTISFNSNLSKCCRITNMSVPYFFQKIYITFTVTQYQVISPSRKYYKRNSMKTISLLFFLRIFYNLSLINFSHKIKVLSSIITVLLKSYTFSCYSIILYTERYINSFSNIWKEYFSTLLNWN